MSDISDPEPEKSDQDSEVPSEDEHDNMINEDAVDPVNEDDDG